VLRLFLQNRNLINTRNLVHSESVTCYCKQASQRGELKKCVHAGLDNLKVLRDTPQVREKVVAIFAEAEPFVPSDNVDAQLYNGFFSDADRAAMNIVLQTEPRNLPALDLTFADKRIEKLIFNYRARNYPGTLDENEQARWLQHRRNVFTPEYLQAYAQELEMLYGQYEGNNEKLTLLKALYQYAQVSSRPRGPEQSRRPCFAGRDPAQRPESCCPARVQSQSQDAPDLQPVRSRSTPRCRPDGYCRRLSQTEGAWRAGRC
jgi:hypothetical protein